MIIQVGDVCLRPLPPRVEVNKIGCYVVTVTEVSDTNAIVTTGEGTECTVPIKDLSLLIPYREIIQAFTKKGVELVDRVEKG